MKKILIAVDDTKGMKNVFSICSSVCSYMHPEKIVLLYVEKFEGRSLIDEMLGDAEIKTLKDVLAGTEYQEALDKKAQTILGYYKKTLEDKGLTGVMTLVKKGHPAEEILNTAKEEGVDIIIIGSRGRRVGRLFMGSISREVANNSEISVLLVR